MSSEMTCGDGNEAYIGRMWRGLASAVPALYGAIISADGLVLFGVASFGRQKEGKRKAKDVASGMQHLGCEPLRPRAGNFFQDRLPAACKRHSPFVDSIFSIN
jgi:hypothetical protein